MDQFCICVSYMYFNSVCVCVCMYVCVCVCVWVWVYMCVCVCVLCVKVCVCAYVGENTGESLEKRKFFPRGQKSVNFLSSYETQSVVQGPFRPIFRDLRG